MGARENIQKLVEKKLDEARELEIKTREAYAYVQALQDSIRFLPKEDRVGFGGTAEHTLRAGTDLAQAREIIAAEGKPMHVNDLLEKMGKSVDQQTRVSLVGTLGSYSRKGRIFTRPAPNTFGLVGMSPLPQTDELPENFGKMD